MTMRALSVLALLAALVAPEAARAQSYFPTVNGSPAPGSVQLCMTGGVAGPCAPMPAAAGEAHLGSTGGDVLSVQVAQTVTSGAAYPSGAAVGGLVTIAGAGRVNGGSGYLQNLAIRTKSAQTIEIDAVLFRDNPSSSTCTDKTALAVAAADYDKVIPPVQVTSWMSLGTPSVGSAGNLAIAYQLPPGATALYACLVTRGTPTYASASDVSVIFGLVRN